MKEYLVKYPDEQSNVDAMVYAFGIDKTESILLDAIKQNKKVELIENETEIDFLGYKLI